MNTAGKNVGFENADVAEMERPERSALVKERSPRIIISGGGTGGHIYPALAIANELKYIDEDIEILFVGATGKMEMQKVPAAGYNIKGLWISGIQRKTSWKNLLFPVKLFSSIIQARFILGSFKPDVVVGVGGYASGPLLYAATGKGLPCLIQEQNSYAGLTNKWLAKKVQKICVAYEGMEKFFPAKKLILTGNPVRKDIIHSNDKRDEAFKYFGLDPDKKVLLVIGGSLGARTINESVIAGIDKIIEDDVQLIWQTGKVYHEKALAATEKKLKSHIKIFDFINRMDYAYAAATSVISRAGALSISELCLVGKPTVLVPSPNVAEDHQTKNAMSLVERNAAILVKDIDAGKDLLAKALELIHNDNRKAELSANIRNMAKPNAGKTIANEILKLIRN